MRALLAGWRVSLHRTRADWPIVAAAWLITLLAATLLAAGAIYPAAAAEAGLRRTFLDAPAAAANVSVSRYVPAVEAAEADAMVQGELRRVFGSLNGDVVRDWRGSATLALPDLPGMDAGDQALLGYVDGLAEHATLSDGAWPAKATDPSAPVESVISQAVAEALALEVGETIELVDHPSTHPVVVPVRIVGIFGIDRPSHPVWNGDQQLLDGVRANGQYQTFGPFLMTMEDLLARTDGSIRMQWRTLIRFEAITVDEAGPLRGRVDALPDRLEAGGGEGYEVATELGTILRDSERSLLVSRTGVLLLMAQLAILAAYAIVLTASLLVDHRRVDTALLRSRGAGPGQVALLALMEGMLLAVPAVLLAPLLAVAALDVLNVAGPLAAVGLRIEPRVTPDAYVAAGAAGFGAALLLALPAFLAARGFAAEQGGLSRQETRTFGQRMGLDVALLALTGIALWQLRLYGAPLTRTVQGSLGLDPLLVAAPAIGLVAGAVVALRILPLLAQVVERAVTRGRDLVLSLGSRQLARRPLRYTRSALLLMLAMSMGVFALSYADTWSSSQRDQAAYQAGAHVRVVPGRVLTGLPAWALPAAYRGLNGVEMASPVERITGRIAFAGARSVDLLALDAEAADGLVLRRGDEIGGSMAELFRPLREGRPEGHPPTLPEGAAYLRMTPRIDIQAMERFIYDEETGEGVQLPLDPLTAGVRVSAYAVLRDVNGLLYRVEAPLQGWAGETLTLVLPLMPMDPRATAGLAGVDAQLDGPVAIAALGIEVWIPQDAFISAGSMGVDALAAAREPADPGTAVALTGGDDWLASVGQGRRGQGDVPQVALPAPVLTVGHDGPLDTIFGYGSIGPSARIRFRQASLAPPITGIPVLVNRAFLTATTSEADETVAATLDGVPRRFRIVGVIDTFPTTDPSRALLIIDEPTLAVLRLDATGSSRNPDEWWLSTATGTEESVAAALSAEPFGSTSVITFVGRARSLSTDPVALGIIGALSLGFVATGLFAIVGLTVSGAVSARQRRTEFALLRALGISGRQLLGSLWLENGSVVLVSLVGGTGLGLLLGWAVLPFTTVTQQAVAPIPSVIVHVPWDRVLVLEVISAGALAIAVVVIGGVLRRLGVGSVLRMGED